MFQPDLAQLMTRHRIILVRLPLLPHLEIEIEVCHKDLRIVYLRRDGAAYYCDRLVGIRSPDPYWLALHLIHPDYLYSDLVPVPMN
jgi:hypothetical protein